MISTEDTNSKNINILPHQNSIGIEILFQYLGSAVQLLSGLFFYLIAVRLFDTTKIGAISLFVAIIGLFTIIFSFGLTKTSQHFTSYILGKGDYASLRRAVYKILSFGLVLSIFSLIVLQLLSGIISHIFFHSKIYIEIIRILSIVLLGNILFGILNGIILGMQKFKISAIISVATWLVYYFGALGFAIFYRTIYTLILGWILGIFIGVVIEFIFVFSSVNKFKIGGFPISNYSIFEYSTPLLLSGLVTYGASYADRFIVSDLMNLSYLGIYNFTLLVTTFLVVFTVPLNNILLSKFSQMYGNNDVKSIKSTSKFAYTLLSYFYVPAALGIAALAPMILNVLGGQSYIDGTEPLRIILFLSAIFVSHNIIIQVISSIRRTKLLLYSSLLALISNVVLSVILIPIFNLIGAAIGYSSVFSCIFIVLYFYARKESVMTIDMMGMLKIWVSSIVMYITVILCVHLLNSSIVLLPLYIIIGGTVYVVISKIFKVFKEENGQLIIFLFPSKFKIVRKLLSLIILY